MSRRGIWSVLGIDPTTDAREIRRAYAQALKLTNPEDDAEGFQQLRAAYDAALARARRPGGLGAATDTVRPQAQPAEPPAAEPAGLSIRFKVPAGGQSAPPAPSAPTQPPAPPSPPPPRPSQSAPAAEPAATSPPPSGPRLLPIVDKAAEQARDVAAQRADFDSRRQELLRRISDPAVGEDALVAAFDAVLAAPAMEMVGTYEQGELWLAAVVARHFPRTDPLVRPAIGRFGWSGDTIGRPNHDVLAVLARLRDLDAARTLASRNHPQHTAFESLRRPPTFWRSLRYRLTLGLPAQATQLLEGIRTTRPGLGSFLDEAAVKWWQAYHAKPRLRPGGIWALLISAALMAFVVAVEASNPTNSSGSLGLVLILAIAVASGVLARLFLVDWPRAIWRKRWAEKAPVWQRLGWAPAGLAVVIASGLAPTSGWVTVGLAVLSVLALLWTTTTSEPDRRPSTASDIPHWRSLITLGFWILTRSSRSYPWQVRTLAGIVLPGLVVAVSDSWLRPERQLQVALATLGAAAAFAMGSGSLLQAWASLDSVRAKWGSQVAVALLALVAAALLVAYGQGAHLAPAATAVSLAAFLASRTAAQSLSDTWSGARDLFLRFGWIPLFVIIAGFAADRRVGLLCVGSWMLGGVAIALSGAAAGLRQPRRKAPRRRVAT